MISLFEFQATICKLYKYEINYFVFIIEYFQTESIPSLVQGDKKNHQILKKKNQKIKIQNSKKKNSKNSKNQILKKIYEIMKKKKISNSKNEI